MAGGSVLVDDGEQRVAVAVGAHFHEALGVAGCFAFAPELLARAGVVCHLSGGEGLREGVAVHPGEHERFAVVLALGDDGDESVLVEAQAVYELGGVGVVPVALHFGEVVGGHCGEGRAVESERGRAEVSRIIRRRGKKSKSGGITVIAEATKSLSATSADRRFLGMVALAREPRWRGRSRIFSFR